MPDDDIYADSITDEQMLAWCRRWKRGNWLGFGAAPKWNKDSFDCTRRAQHFLAFIHEQNARSGMRVVQPVHWVKSKWKGVKHAYARFVQDGTWRFFNAESEEFSERLEAAHDYAEMV
jgi:hypothetical protein